MPTTKGGPNIILEIHSAQAAPNVVNDVCVRYLIAKIKVKKNT